MKKLKLYVLKEVFKALIPAYLALTLIMVLGFSVQVLHEGLDVVRLPRLMPPMFMHSVPLVLPAAFLTAVIMAFGRLSGDNEIIAIRVGGIHLFSVVFPVCVAALLLSGVAAYFQFEVVPSARRQMKLLKYEALKQILIDKVALSAQRRFSFGDWHIQYDDFVDGRMANVLLLKVRDGTPQLIGAAAEGSIVLDPNAKGSVALQLTECVVTSFAEGELRSPVKAKEVPLLLDVSPDIEEVSGDVKYLGAAALWNYARRLREEVSGHQFLFPNPDGMSNALRRRMSEIRIEIKEKDRIIESARQEIQKYTVEDRPRYEQFMQLTEEQIAQARELIAELEAQRSTLLKQITERREKEEGEVESGGSIPALGQQLQEVRDKIEAQEREIAKLEERRKERTRKIKEKRQEAADYAEEAARVEQEKAELLGKHRAIAEVKETADAQESYRSARVRIHKRLAQSVSVLVFALIGIPLGIMCRRHSIVVALGASFSIVLFLFYPFLIGGQILAETGMLPVAPAMWAGDGLTFAIGSALMARVLYW